MEIREAHDINELINAVVDAREKARVANCLRVAEYNKWEEANHSLFSKEWAAIGDLDLAETELREMALAVYAETKDKAVAPGVGIRVMTKLDYDSNEALGWAMHHELALKLDTGAFGKIAKANILPFVTIYEEPQATIAQELVKIEEEVK